MDQSDFDDIMDLQRTLAKEVAQEEEEENKIELMSIINESTNDKGMVQKEAVMVEAQQQGMDAQSVSRILKELERDNFLIEQSGYLKTL